MVFDLEIGHFLEVASIVVTWWIVAFCAVMVTQTVMVDQGTLNTQQVVSRMYINISKKRFE